MKLSFIIPAYNAAGYLHRCLDSIARQPFDDYEILVIDDGSTDETAEVIARYAALDPRIRSWHRQNGGQGAARSFGVREARGEYIWFVDSDDWLLESTLRRVARILEAERPDVFLANFEFTFDDRPPQPGSLTPPALVGRTIDPRESPEVFAAVSCWNAPPWRLVCRRALLLEHDIFFASGVFYEDHPFAIKLMLTASRVFIDGPVTYGYYQRATSTTKVNDKKAFDFLEIRRQCLALFRQFGVFERFEPVVVTYIAPLDFYRAHVAEPFRQEFLERLNADLTEDERAIVERRHDAPARLFLQAVRARDPALMERVLKRQRLRRALGPEGVARLRARARGWLGRKVRGAYNRVRGMLMAQQQHAGFDYAGRRFLQAGQGTRIEDITIDVRVKQEARPYVRIGEQSHVGGYFVFERGVGEITIGSRSSIGGGCQLIVTQPEGIRIGSNTMLSWRCTLIDSNSHSTDPEVRANDAYDWKCGVDAGRIGAYKDWTQVESAPIVIGDCVWVGFETAIMKGVTIGDGAVVGSRSMVTKDVAPWTIVAGTPARFVGFVPRRTWSWEEIVHAFQGDPSQRDMLIDALIHTDVKATLKRYRESEEFRDTAVVMRAHTPAPRRMLDIGGGSGVVSVAFGLEGFDVTLVEPSSDDIVGTAAAARVLAHAREAFDPTIDQRVRVLQATVETAEVEGPFDVVYCRQVAHHFPDPVAALRRMCALTAPDGVAMLVREHVIYDAADHQTFLDHHPFHRYYGGEQAYTVEQYCDFARQAGFEVVQVLAFKDSAINYFPHPGYLVDTLDERDVPGRPYTFVLKPRREG